MNMRMIRDISDFIFIEDKLEKADAILIPGGAYPELPERAAGLFNSGLADFVIPSGKFSVKFGKFLGVKSKADIYNKDYYTECEFYTDVLMANGVPGNAIIEENESQHTADNARFTRRLLDERGINLKKAIICCKAFHARRCLMFYQFCFPETEFMIAPVYGPDVMDITKDNWYTTDFGLTRVLGELARLGTQFMPEFQQLKDSLKGQKNNIILREYAPDDLDEITELFYNTVHNVNAADYSKEQLNVWATGQVDKEVWNSSLLSHYSVVALWDEKIVGFGDIDDTGYLDRLYVHKDYQRKGVATAICNALERAFNVHRIITHASITAKSFFERRGYKVVN